MPHKISDLNVALFVTVQRACKWILFEAFTHMFLHSGTIICPQKELLSETECRWPTSLPIVQLDLSCDTHFNLALMNLIWMNSSVLKSSLKCTRQSGSAETGLLYLSHTLQHSESLSSHIPVSWGSWGQSLGSAVIWCPWSLLRNLTVALGLNLLLSNPELQLLRDPSTRLHHLIISLIIMHIVINKEIVMKRYWTKLWLSQSPANPKHDLTSRKSYAHDIDIDIDISVKLLGLVVFSIFPSEFMLQ